MTDRYNGPQFAVRATPANKNMLNMLRYSTLAHKFTVFKCICGFVGAFVRFQSVLFLLSFSAMCNNNNNNNNNNIVQFMFST